uniref:Uncharacterized protein n=1 Tax=Oryza meridionalis TaxID=40149 RepID=A0A0E0C2P5_9ORYZ
MWEEAGGGWRIDGGGGWLARQRPWWSRRHEGGHAASWVARPAVQASCGSGRASWRPAAVWSCGRRHGARGRRQRVLVAAGCDSGRLAAMAVATMDRRSVTLSGVRFGASLLPGCVLALSMCGCN